MIRLPPAGKRRDLRACRGAGPVPRSAGFTLLELMLALSLTVVILMTISMAVDFHLRYFESRRTYLEESQLARSVLQIMAQDIRSAVVQSKQDLSKLPLPEPDKTTDLAMAVNVPARPGIYGNQYELQIDVARLPRQEEFLAMPTGSGIVPGFPFGQIPSDVKNVTYYVQTDGSVFGAAAPNLVTSDLAQATNAATGGSGLVRRQLDRAVAQWAVSNGNALGLEQAGEILAPEVLGVEFRYFDGLEWRTEWDTEAEQKLPVAIEITLSMQPTTGSNPQSAAAMMSGMGVDMYTEAGVNYYRLVVNVPMGVPTTEEEPNY